MNATTRSRERWRKVPGASSYEVSDLGRIRSFRRFGRARHDTSTPRVLSPAVDRDGYAQTFVMYDDGVRRMRKVHQLVLEAFVGHRPNARHVTRHLDGDPSNNALVNLKWGTLSENMRDTIAHGTDTRGERNGRAKLTRRQVETIRHALARGVQGRALARRFGVSDATICRVKKGHRYAY